MNHQKGTLKGAGGAVVFHQCWLPEGPSRAMLLIVHGLAEHSGRYMNLVDHFVPQGYAVCALDHIGHGRSEGRRAHIRRFEDYTDTLNIFVESACEMAAGKPIFLVGHSMGGLVGAAYLIDHPAAFAGAVLSGPSVKAPDSIPAVVIFAGKALSVLMPTAGMIALEARGVSRDPAVVQSYLSDPLVHHGKVSARLGAELLGAMRRVTASASRIRLPLLVLQGGADSLVDPQGTRMFFETVGSQDKTIKIYDGLYHEVFNEPEHDRVLNDMQQWLEAHVAA